MEERTIHFSRVDENLWEIPAQGEMRVPGRVYCSEALMKSVKKDKSPRQVVNVSTLPGIQRYSLAMPDIHWGYGFPIGGVAAMDLDEGVVSPGGVGYDINCGCRLISSSVAIEDVRARIKDLVVAMFKNVPCGVGSSGAIQKLSAREMRNVMRKGAGWAVERGYGDEGDLARTEEWGCMDGADPDAVSGRAVMRGAGQLGTLGSGNHFLEIGVVDEVYRPEIAGAFGLEKGRITILIHTGSRGFGHQVCDDALRNMTQAVKRYGIALPDRQLACAPVRSDEGRHYLGAMACAANFAWANRQCIQSLAIDALLESLGASPREAGFRLVYDVCHNIAKIETHNIEGEEKRLCIHRKGATRAFPPDHPGIPSEYRSVGQPVLIPGDMGTCSYVSVGTEEAIRQTFGSTCHGAGRMMSRKKAIQAARGREIRKE
ncbi:RtcB family protein, partial [Thermodesulfobacteriota bacterium]